MLLTLPACLILKSVTREDIEFWRIWISLIFTEIKNHKYYPFNLCMEYYQIFREMAVRDGTWSSQVLPNCWSSCTCRVLTNLCTLTSCCCSFLMKATMMRHRKYVGVNYSIQNIGKNGQKFFFWKTRTRYRSWLAALWVRLDHWMLEKASYGHRQSREASVFTVHTGAPLVRHLPIICVEKIKINQMVSYIIYGCKNEFQITGEQPHYSRKFWRLGNSTTLCLGEAAG